MANIFQQYLTPPKSVMDYSAEMDQADTRRNALQTSALGLQQAQATLDNTAQVNDQRNALRAAVTSGQIDLSNPDHVGRALAIAPDVAPALLKTVQDGATARAQTAKYGADANESKQKTAASEFELRIKKSDQAVKDIAGFATPQDALASLQAHVTAGDVDPAKAQMIQQSMPQDPAKFAEWKVGMIRNIMTAKEQMEYSTPNANTVATNRTSAANNAANNARIAAEGAANRANQVKVTGMVSDRQEPGDVAASIDPKRMAFMVDQALRGDATVYQNLGRGKQGAANLLALRGAVADEAQKRGMTGADLAAVNADYQGQKAGLRTSSMISAKIENAAAEADQLAPLAIEAGRNVARSGFLPFGRAQVMFDNQTNDPAINKFATANMGLATAYASAMARGNKPTVSDNEHARELLSTAKSQQAYESVVGQMQQEIKAAQAAPRHVRDNLRGDISGKGNAPAKQDPAVPDDIAALLQKHGGK